MVQQIEILAKKISALDAKNQEVLLQMVAEINFRRGLEALSKKYRLRLQKEKNLNQRTEEIFTELRRIRNEIARFDYHKII